MNLFSLVLKQMRQRVLSTTLTVMSVALGVSLAVAIYMVSREGENVFAQTDYGYELVIGPKGSGTELVLNSVYHLRTSQGNIPYSLYEDLATPSRMSASGGGKTPNVFRGQAQWAVPLAVGDSYQRHPIVATTPTLFGMDNEGKPLTDDKKIPEYRVGKRFEFAEGRAFAASKFEAVIGSQVAKDTALKVGSVFQATHGFPGPTDIPDIHAEKWTIVGVLAPTHTANDRCLFIPLPTFYAIFEHEAGEETNQAIKDKSAGTMAPKHPASAPVASAPAATATAASAPASTDPEEEPKAYTLMADGTVIPKLPKEEWEVSSILVKAWSGATRENIKRALQVRPEAMAVNPAETMHEFFENFLGNIVKLLLLASSLVVFVAAVSILVSIYSAVTSRSREIAILRALGATRRRIMAVTCLEAGLGGLIGAVAGLLGGHLLGAIGSRILESQTGQGIPWWKVDQFEIYGCCAVVIMAVLAGLVPAIKAYSVPVAENLNS